MARGSGLASTLLKYGYSLTALALYGMYFVLNAWKIDGVRFVLPSALVLVGGMSIWMVRKLRHGDYFRRRLVEGVFSALLAIDLGCRATGNETLQYISFAVFLAAIYTGFPAKEIFFLFLIQFVLRLAGRLEPTTFHPEVLYPMAFLFGWIVLALIFRANEQKKMRGVINRLNLYENEALTFQRAAKGLESVMGQDEKRRMHLASMIREREASFRDLLLILSKICPSHACALYLYDPDQEHFLLKESISHDEIRLKARVPSAEGVFGALLRQKKTLRLVSQEDSVRGLAYYENSIHLRSVLVCPINPEGILKGVVVIDRQESCGFSKEEEILIDQVIAQLSRSIDYAEAIHTYFHLKEEIESVYRASTSLHRSLRMDDILDTFLQATHEIASYDWGLVILSDSATEVNRVAAEFGPDTCGWVGRTFACSEERGLISWVIKNQMPLSYETFRQRNGKTPLFHKHLKVPNVYDSIYICPIYMKEEPMGAILLASRKNHAFSSSVRTMIEVIAHLATVSLKNSRMVKKLETLATTDGLTGLINHRTFQETLAEEIERTQRQPSAVSLLLIDIDYFKKFNDEFGHPVGDFVLKSIATVLRDTVRKVDKVARYGGEEFAVILMNTSVIGAMQMAQRIVSEVAKKSFEYQNLTLRVTVSAGVATYPDDATVREELIERADMALYASKRQGRNRATAYHATMQSLSKEEKEEKLIAAAEEQLRQEVDPISRTV